MPKVEIELIDINALDAYIAEYLFGWIWRVHGVGKSFGRSLHAPGMREDATLATGDEPLYINAELPKRPGLANVPEFITGDGMILCVEELNERGWRVEMVLDSGYGVLLEHATLAPVASNGESLPIAVALAIEAMGKDE